MCHISLSKPDVTPLDSKTAVSCVLTSIAWLKVKLKHLSAAAQSQSPLLTLSSSVAKKDAFHFGLDKQSVDIKPLFKHGS